MNLVVLDWRRQASGDYRCWNGGSWRRPHLQPRRPTHPPPRACLPRPPGVYVAGDPRTKPVRQLVTAAADGAVAATAAIHYVNGTSNR